MMAAASCTPGGNVAAARGSSWFSRKWASVMIAKTIVEPLVVGVIEALLLKRPFLVPIDFGHEGEVGMALAHFLRRSRPKQRGTMAPSALEYVGQDEHG